MAPPRKKQRTSSEVSTSAAPAAPQSSPLDSVTVADQDKVDITSSEKTSSKHSSSLFVRSLPASTTSQTLTELFSNSYPIKHATAVIDKDTQQCKGYGFVTFADVEDAVRAKTEFNGHVLEGKKLRVEIAEKRQREDEKAKQKSAMAAGDVETSTVAKAKTPAQKARERRTKTAADSDGTTSTKLIVRNLPWSIKKAEQLGELFAKYGKVKKTVLPKKKTGLLAGFGFVIMKERAHAEKVLQEANGMEIDGRPVAVDWAVEKEVYEQQEGEQEEDSEELSGDAADGHEKEEDFDHIRSDDDASDEDGNEDETDIDDEDLEGDEMEDEDERHLNQAEDRSCTLFVRNLPFTATDETLEDHFRQFGSTRYARVVMDQGTERSKGTGFVCFYQLEDAEACLRGAPKVQIQKSGTKDAGLPQAHSVLQDENRDPTGQYTLDGRVLQISKAVDKHEANRLTKEGVNYRFNRDKDKRRLYLLSEGTVPSNSKLWEALSVTDRAMRESSAKQRKSILDSNPSLNLSLTRLSVRNIPRSITSKDLKQLAREAVVGFATDVKAGTRQRLSREELSRGAEEMAEAELERKRHAKGIVRQAKIVFEGQEGSKVDEKTGGGRSRGYGFIEYYTHRSALMGLRWLNGHVIDYQTKDQKNGKNKAAIAAAMQDRKKRLIVEFAIENAQVVGRRKERESKSRETSKAGGNGQGFDQKKTEGHNKRQTRQEKKRKRGANDDGQVDIEPADPKKTAKDEKLAKQQRIIQQKRMKRRERKGKT